jgi:hypothetical protein
MLVRMKKKIGGYRDMVEWPEPGGCIEVPDSEGRDLVANGYAVEVLEAPDELDAVSEEDPDANDVPAEDDGAPAGVEDDLWVETAGVDDAPAGVDDDGSAMTSKPSRRRSS